MIFCDLHALNIKNDKFDIIYNYSKQLTVFPKTPIQCVCFDLNRRSKIPQIQSLLLPCEVPTLTFFGIFRGNLSAVTRLPAPLWGRSLTVVNQTHKYWDSASNKLKKRWTEICLSANTRSFWSWSSKEICLHLKFCEVTDSYRNIQHFGQISSTIAYFVPCV